MSADVRAAAASDALQRLVANRPDSDATEYDAKTIRVVVASTAGGRALSATDAQHPDPLPILEVTAPDAHAARTTIPSLAKRWQQTLQTSLRAALIARRPETRSRNFSRLGNVAVPLALLTLLAIVVLVISRGRLRRLQRADAESDAPDRPHATLSVVVWSSAAVLWGLAVAWLVFAVWSLIQFPETRPLGETIVGKALGLTLLLIAAVVIDRALNLVIAVAVRAFLPHLHRSKEDNRSRDALRIPTTIRAFQGFKTAVVVVAVCFATLAELGMPIYSVVTFGGVAVIAVSFAAQNFLCDFLSGFLVIVEDQYAIGDLVTINDNKSGIVEVLTMRMVQLRNRDGDLVTIGHGSVTSVTNRSRNWSRVDYHLAIDPAADADRATRIVGDMVRELAAEASWSEVVQAEPEWIGIDMISSDSVVIRAAIRTAPLRQFDVRREVNARVLKRMLEADIRLGKGRDRR